MVRIDFNRLRFLVIDDNAHMRRILRTLLHGFGAREVYEAEDGAAGLEAFTHYIPDIVITDWAMPIFDGLELMQMIRQPGANANPYVAIIMLTGHSEKKRVTAARDAGVTEFLAKPISAKGLYQRIINVVANPRPFIKTKTYFGPDRRRNVNFELYRPGTPKGRQGRRHPADPLARQSPRPGLTKAIRNVPLERHRGDRHLRRPRGYNAGKQTARCGVQRNVRSRQRRSRSTRRKGAGGTILRIRELDGFRMRSARSGPPRPGQGFHPSPTKRRFSTRPTISKAKPQRSVIRRWRPRLTAFADLSSTRPISTRIPPQPDRPARGRSACNLSRICAL